MIRLLFDLIGQVLGFLLVVLLILGILLLLEELHEATSGRNPPLATPAKSEFIEL